MTERFGMERRVPGLLRGMALVCGLGLVVGTAGCGDDDNDVVGPIPVATVLTFKDSSFNFTTLHTFMMPDTVVHLAPITGTPLDPTRQFDQTALNQVRTNLLARGYTEAAAGTRADFVVLVGATATQNYNAFVGYNWFTFWGFFPEWAIVAPGADASWTIVYPWFGVVGVTAYDRGTLIVDMIPTASVNPLAKSIQSVWTGVATGLLSNATNATVTAAVNEMFRQSPYLVATP